MVLGNEVWKKLRLQQFFVNSLNDLENYLNHVTSRFRTPMTSNSNEDFDSPEPSTQPVNQVDYSFKKQIGPYKLLEQIGQGGMGTVWVAEQREPVKRRVALKLIRGGAGSDEIIARFEAERQALAMMEHQNIARILDAGTMDDGNPFFVMELVKGIPITEYCDSNKLSIDDRLSLFVPVCSAIQHAHQKGIIHRDIKPTNVLVTLYDGKPVPKVIDFGLAKALDHTARLTDRTIYTEYGKVVGTVQYMSPEQAEMNALDVDTRTDVYSLGVLLYELLTGSTPLDKDTLGRNALLQLLEVIRDKEPPRPSIRLSDSGEASVGISEQRRITPAKLRTVLRGELDWVVMKALEKDRSRRYDSASDFAHDIERFLNGEPVVARPPSATYLVSKFVRKNKALVATILTITFCLLAGLAGITWFAFAETNQRKIAEQKTDDARKAEDLANEKAELAAKKEKEATASKQETEKALAKAKFSLAIERWKEDPPRVMEAHRILDSIPKKRRNIEWRFAKKQFEGSYATIFGHKNPITRIVILRQKPWIISGAANGSIKIWHRDTFTLVRKIELGESNLTDFDINPDGSLIVIGSWGGRLTLWDANSGDMINELGKHGNRIHSVRFSPDSTTVLSTAVGKGQPIKLWDVDSAKEKGTIDADLYYTFATFSQDGSVFSSNRLGVFEINSIENRDSPLKQPHSHRHYSSASFGPYGNRIACVGGKMLVIWDLNSLEDKYRILSANLKSVSFSPDGNLIVAGKQDGTIEIIDAETLETLQILKGHFGSVSDVAFMPDGRRIVSAAQSMKIWEIATADRVLSNIQFFRPSKVIGIDHFGRRIAIIDQQRIRPVFGKGECLRIMDANSGEQIVKLGENSGSIVTIDFSPTENKIVAGHFDGTVAIWELTRNSEPIIVDRQNTLMRTVAFSRDGRSIVAAGENASLNIYDSTNGKMKQPLSESSIIRFKPDGPPAFLGSITTIDCCVDGKHVLVGYSKGFVQLWDIINGKSLHVFFVAPEGVNCLKFSPNGKSFAAASVSRDLCIFDLNTRKNRLRLEGSRNVKALHFTLDGKRIIGLTNNMLKFWDTDTGEELYAIKHPLGEESGKNFMGIGRKEQKITTTGFASSAVWECSADYQVRVLSDSNGSFTNSKGFGKDGERIYSKEIKQSVNWDSYSEWTEGLSSRQVWDAETGLRLPGEHWLEPYSMDSISPDKRYQMFRNIVIDRRYAASTNYKRRLSAHAAIALNWHKSKAEAYRNSKNWYAATFHYSWCITKEPENETFRMFFWRCHKKLTEEFKVANKPLDPYLAPVMIRAHELARGFK